MTILRSSLRIDLSGGGGGGGGGGGQVSYVIWGLDMGQVAYMILGLDMTAGKLRDLGAIRGLDMFGCR